MRTRIVCCFIWCDAFYHTIIHRTHVCGFQLWIYDNDCAHKFNRRGDQCAMTFYSEQPCILYSTTSILTIFHLWGACNEQNNYKNDYWRLDGGEWCRMMAEWMCAFIYDINRFEKCCSWQRAKRLFVRLENRTDQHAFFSNFARATVLIAHFSYSII